MSEGKPDRMASRYWSLDVFRGITIAGMILVNNAGDGAHRYTVLEHAAWDGWTPTDFVFPFFVFILGVAVAFSFSNRTDMGQDRGKLILHILKRTSIIFALGLIGNYDPGPGLAHLRIMGVLQRLALVYLFVSLIAMWSGTRGRVIWAVVMLGAYWLLMKLVPVPGYGAGDLTREGNLAGYIDNILLKGHLYTPNWDPEGILHTLPAIASGLIGLLTGEWLRSARLTPEKVAGMFAVGSVLIVAGQCLHPLFPINKNLWSPSYVLFVGGLAMSFLAFCVWLVDYQGKKKWSMGFVVLGTNSLFIYLISGLMRTILTNVPMTTSAGERVDLWKYLFVDVYSKAFGLLNGSLFLSLSYVAIWIGIAALLYRKRIFIKV